MRIKYLFIIIPFLLAQDLRSQSFGNINVFPALPYEHLYITALLTAGNGVFITRNLKKMKGSDPQRSNAGFGLITGTTQMMYGLLYNGLEKGYTREVAAVDITVGLATIATSALRLFKKHPATEGPVNLNFVSLPNNRTSRVTVGVMLSGNF